MSDCRRCVERGKTWEGDDPKCAFRNAGYFDTENWNCATMTELRHLVDYGTSWSSDDQRVGVFGRDSRFLILGWYKSRGRTEFATVLSATMTEPLSVEAAEEFLDGAA